MARTTGTWGSIERIGNGYRGTYANPIKGAKPSRIKGPVFKTKGETHAWLEQEHAAVREHRQGIRRWTPPKERQVQLQQELLRQNITLASYAKKWLANYHTKTGSEPAEAYKRKLREYQRWLERTCPFWNNLIINITEAEVTKWRNHAQIPAHPKNKAWFQLKQIMEQAKNEGLIRQNPVIGTAPRMPRSKQAEIPEATASQLHTIYENMPAPYNEAIWLGALLGLRIGEVCALQVGDIDYEQSKIHIRHSVGKSEGDRGPRKLKEPKNQASRTAKYMPPQLVQQLRPITEGRRPEEQLFQAPRAADGIMRDTTLRHYFDEAKAKAGRKDLVFHTLRATAIDTAITSGASLKDAMAFGRHSDAKTSIEHYQRVHDTQQKRIATTVADKLLRPVRTRETIMKEITQKEAELAQLKTELAQLEQD